MPARRRRPGRGPVRAAQLVPLPGRQRLDRPRARSSCSRCGATSSLPATTTRWSREALADGRGGAAAARDQRPRRRRAARPRRPPRPDLRHVADARAIGVRRARCGSGRCAAAEEMARRDRRRDRGRRGGRLAIERGAGRVRATAVARGTTATTPTTTAARSSSDSVMADQLAGQWYADADGPRRPASPDDRVDARAAHDPRAQRRAASADGRMGAVNGMRPDGTVDTSSEQSRPRSGSGRRYALAAFMLGRGLADEGWETAARHRRHVTYERGPVVPDARGVRPATATTGRASTCGRSRSGRSRRPCGAGARVRRRSRLHAAGLGRRRGPARRTGRCAGAASSSCSYDGRVAHPHVALARRPERAARARPRRAPRAAAAR